MNSPRREIPFWLLIVAAILLVLGGLLRGRLLHMPGRSVQAAPAVPVHVEQGSAATSLADFKNGFSAVIDPDLPAVVNISSTKVVKQPSAPNVFQDPFFRQFFGNQLGPQQQQPQSEREHSLGSGVIVNPDGYILTNNHVISGATDIEVFTQNRKKYKARLVGADPRTDIAVVKIDASGLPTLTFADSSRIRVGDVVFAIGDPFGIGETATMGIISATGRALGGAIEHYEDFIQTDAPINPGNSGGALIDLRGDLVGINTAIIAGGGGGNEGVGFAIPVNLAHTVMDQLVAHGKVIRGYMGVSIQSVDPDMAKQFGLNQGGGALVGDVTPNGPAAKAGLQRGDIILELDGSPVTSSDDLSLRTSQLPPGSVAYLLVYRNRRQQNVDVTLEAFPENAPASNSAQGGGATLNGLQVENLTSGHAQQLGVPAATTGAVVSAVNPGSSAEAAGIQQGDVIQEVDRKPVHNVQDYQHALAGAGNRTVLLLINRNGTTHYVVVQPQG